MIESISDTNSLLVSVTGIIGALSGGVAAIITALNRRTSRVVESKVENVHAEVTTSNGSSIGQLVEQNLAPSVDGAAATEPLFRQSETPAP